MDIPKAESTQIIIVPCSSALREGELILSMHKRA